MDTETIVFLPQVCFYLKSLHCYRESTDLARLTPEDLILESYPLNVSSLGGRLASCPQRRNTSDLNSLAQNIVIFECRSLDPVTFADPVRLAKQNRVVQ
jgi:hypothetical protein